MAAGFHTHAAVLDGFQCFHINTGGCKQSLTQGGSQLIVIGFQTLFGHLKYLANQGETIAMYAGACHTNEYIAVF